MAWLGRNDTRALEIAAAVKADHETHVKECRDRYLDTKTALDKSERRLPMSGVSGKKVRAVFMG